MKFTAVFLIFCLLLAGTVSAVAVNVSTAGAVRVSVSKPTSGMTLSPGTASRIPALATEAGRGMLEVYSVPSGATVTLDGNTNPGDRTPVQYSLPAGSHTVVLSLSGYQDYTETFSIDAGAIKDINADLKKKITAIPGRVAAGATIIAPQGTTVIPSPASTGQATPAPAIQPVTVRTLQYVPGAPAIATTTPVPWACPNADWSCLTGEEAAQQFGYPNARYGDDPCGYAQENGQTVARYCFMDADSTGSLPHSVLSAGTVKDGDDIYILNQTWIQHGVVTRSTETGASGQSPFQSVFSFFNSILGGSAKPGSRLTIVGFAPQPEPPKIFTGADNNFGSALDLVSLNPQPEPPAQAPVAGSAT